MLQSLVIGPHQVLEEVTITEVSLSQDGRSVEQDKRYHGNLTKLLPMGNEVEDFHELLAELTRQGPKMYHPAADIDKVNVGSLPKRQRLTKIKEEPANLTAKPIAEINHHHHQIIILESASESRPRYSAVSTAPSRLAGERRCRCTSPLLCSQHHHFAPTLRLHFSRVRRPPFLTLSISLRGQ